MESTVDVARDLHGAGTNQLRAYGVTTQALRDNSCRPSWIIGRESSQGPRHVLADGTLNTRDAALRSVRAQHGRLT